MEGAGLSRHNKTAMTENLWGWKTPVFKEKMKMKNVFVKKRLTVNNDGPMCLRFTIIDC